MRELQIRENDVSVVRQSITLTGGDVGNSGGEDIVAEEDGSPSRTMEFDVDRN